MKNSNLGAVLDGVAPHPEVIKDERRRMYFARDDGKDETMVGASVPKRYARNLAFLHAETGLTKKQLLMEALDMLFTAKGGQNVK